VIDFEKTINAAIAKERAVPRIRSGKFNPSSFGMCYRQQYWNRKNIPKTNPPDQRTFRVFKCGNIFEDFVANHLSGVARHIPCETNDIKGEADFVDDVCVYDTKSQHSKSFWYIKKCKDIVKEKYHNWLQVMWYAAFLQKDFASLVIISKDDLCIWQHTLKLDDYWRREIWHELATLRCAWLNKKPPPALPRCDYTYNKKTNEFKYWHCTYCGFLDLCKETEGDQWPALKLLKEFKDKLNKVRS